MPTLVPGTKVEVFIRRKLSTIKAALLLFFFFFFFLDNTFNFTYKWETS